MRGDSAEILDEIVRQLGAEAQRSELERAIDDSFWFHRSLDRMFARASMTAMIEDARQIADLIARLENKLADSSRTLLYDIYLRHLGRALTARFSRMIHGRKGEPTRRHCWGRSGRCAWTANDCSPKEVRKRREIGTRRLSVDLVPNLIATNVVVRPSAMR
jgi:hypothetical protein